LQQQ